MSTNICHSINYDYGINYGILEKKEFKKLAFYLSF